MVPGRPPSRYVSVPVTAYVSSVRACSNKSLNGALSSSGRGSKLENNADAATTASTRRANTPASDSRRRPTCDGRLSRRTSPELLPLWDAQLVRRPRAVGVHRAIERVNRRARIAEGPVDLPPLIRGREAGVPFDRSRQGARRVDERSELRAQRPELLRRVLT